MLQVEYIEADDTQEQIGQQDGEYLWEGIFVESDTEMCVLMVLLKRLVLLGEGFVIIAFLPKLFHLILLLVL